MVLWGVEKDRPKSARTKKLAAIYFIPSISNSVHAAAGFLEVESVISRENTFAAHRGHLSTKNSVIYVVGAQLYPNVLVPRDTPPAVDIHNLHTVDIIDQPPGTPQITRK